MSNLTAFLLGVAAAYVVSGAVVVAILASRALRTGASTQAETGVVDPTAPKSSETTPAVLSIGPALAPFQILENNLSALADRAPCEETSVQFHDRLTAGVSQNPSRDHRV